jgi:hypothetical protein
MGWFTGDLPGWHTLCYCTINPSRPYTPVWSNYVYIYVWPGATGYGSGPAYGSASGYSSAPQYTTTFPYNANYPYSAASPQSTVSPSGTNSPYNANSPYSTNPLYSTGAGDLLNAGYSSGGAALASSLPQGAPTPPNPNSEQLALPDVSQLQPVAGYYEGQSAQSPASSCPSCAAISGTGLAGTAEPQAISCPACQDVSALGSTGAYSEQQVYSYHEVYPAPSTCRCNQYYIQTWPGRFSTVGGVQLGSTATLLSKISKPGTYWSFEWTQCNSPAGYYCQPEVKCFGYKGVGWQYTIFRGDTPGWHLLLYYCEDWSNWVYIYVWPS